MIDRKQNIDNFDIEISRQYNLDELKAQWLSIENSQTLPFFLTWSWISCWLETYRPELIVVKARICGRVIAVGLFTCSEQIRHGVIKSTQLRLHQMGDPLLDQIWMEFNDFVCVDEYRVYAVTACLKYMLQSDLECNEIVLSMMTSGRADNISEMIDKTYVQMESVSYSSDLKRIDHFDGRYLSMLSSNTRYQINRSKRLYESLYGSVDFQFAGDIDQALSFFREAGKYHRKRWADSGFNNHQFVRFHENLIEREFADKSIDLMRMMAGDKTIAILYFHIVEKDVYFYLQGINYGNDNKLKPGLLAHAYATQYYYDKGMKKYDFMGGYSQYKQQLSKSSSNLVTLCIQKPSVMLDLEGMARTIKRSLKLSGNRNDDR